MLVIFYTSNLNNKYLKAFYNILPPLLLCYFVPAILNYPLNLIDGENSQLYPVARDYFLPASLLMLCLTMDLKAIAKLGSKSLIMFFAAAFAIMISGPIALWCAHFIIPETVEKLGPDLWKGLSTVSGSWIGGTPNQVAMKEMFNVPQDLFGAIVIFDVFVAYLWMAALLYGVNINDKINKWLKADDTSIRELQEKSKAFRSSIERNPTTNDLVILLTIIFIGVGISHFIADLILPIMKSKSELFNRYNLTFLLSKFSWLIIIATTLGILLSFTKARNLEGIGASKFGTIFIYFLVTTIGMQMNIEKIFENTSLFIIGFIWMISHITIITIIAKIIRAPFFFLAVGSQACVGGAASAPVVASAFDSAFAPVGVLLAVLGYAVGTYAAIISAHMMSLI
jgi:uncharacterized membrane protein